MFQAGQRNIFGALLSLLLSPHLQRRASDSAPPLPLRSPRWPADLACCTSTDFTLSNLVFCRLFRIRKCPRILLHCTAIFRNLDRSQDEPVPIGIQRHPATRASQSGWPRQRFAFDRRCKRHGKRNRKRGLESLAAVGDRCGVHFGRNLHCQEWRSQADSGSYYDGVGQNAAKGRCKDRMKQKSASSSSPSKQREGPLTTPKRPSKSCRVVKAMKTFTQVPITQLLRASHDTTTPPRGPKHCPEFSDRRNSYFFRDDVCSIKRCFLSTNAAACTNQLGQIPFQAHDFNLVSPSNYPRIQTRQPPNVTAEPSMLETLRIAAELVT